jgi:hypothetical protein
MLNPFFAWDEAYTQPELAIFPEIWAQFIALLRTTRKNRANRTGDRHRKRNQAIGTGRCTVA